MAAGVTDKLWEVADLVAIVEAADGSEAAGDVQEVGRTLMFVAAIALTAILAALVVPWAYRRLKLHSGPSFEDIIGIVVGAFVALIPPVHCVGRARESLWPLAIFKLTHYRRWVSV